MKRVNCSTIEIAKGVHCSECGWPVIHACVNWDTDKFQESHESDWWGYCSNKACKNHTGEDWFDERPAFIVND